MVAKSAKPTPRFSPVELPPRQYGRKDGLPVVNFSAEEVKAGAKRFEHTLIAKFTFGRPQLKEIHSFFESTWPVSGRITISDIWDSRHLVIILDSEEDVRVALTSPSRKVGHAYFRLFRWSVDYHPKRESTRITTWVRLPNLPLELYDKGFIRSILSSFAFFLDIDDRTKACTNLNLARACIEIDIRDQLPNSIWIQLPQDQGYWQTIEYEGNLAYCSHCKCHGHDISSCRKMIAKRSSPSPTDGIMQEKSQKVVTHPNSSSGEGQMSSKEQWQVVKSKRNKKQVMSSSGLEKNSLEPCTMVESDRIEEADKSLERRCMDGILVSVENTVVQSDNSESIVTSLRDEQVSAEIVGQPQIQNVQTKQVRFQVPRDISKSELKLIRKEGRNPQFNEQLGVLVAPGAISQFNSIQIKAGRQDLIIPQQLYPSSSVSDGSEHCQSNSD